MVRLKFPTVVVAPCAFMDCAVSTIRLACKQRIKTKGPVLASRDHPRANDFPFAPPDGW